MKKAIFYFSHKESQRQYFLLWDPSSDLPATVPMDFITFLQFNGLHDLEFIGGLFSLFHRLHSTGSTLNSRPFPNTQSENDKHLLHYLEEYLDEFQEPLGDQENELNEALINLFKGDYTFSAFYERYKASIAGLCPHPHRQLNDYHSLGYTDKCLKISQALHRERFQEILLQNKLHSPEPPRPYERFKVAPLLTESKRHAKKPELTALFEDLLENNLIAHDAIPHSIRTMGKLPFFLERLGTANLLPANARSGLATRTFSLQTFNTEPLLRQYLNLAAFHQYGDESLVNLPLFDLSSEQIIDKLAETYIVPSRMVNFTDANGDTLLPMIYCSHFKVEGENNLHALAPFNVQNYEVFDASGMRLSSERYYDCIHLSPAVAYFQKLDLSGWDRISINPESHAHFIQSLPLEIKVESLGEIEQRIIQTPVNAAALNGQFSRAPIEERNPKKGNSNHAPSEDELPF